jgi:hypothetical protein
MNVTIIDPNFNLALELFHPTFYPHFKFLATGTWLRRITGMKFRFVNK